MDRMNDNFEMQSCKAESQALRTGVVLAVRLDPTQLHLRAHVQVHRFKALICRTSALCVDGIRTGLACRASRRLARQQSRRRKAFV
jgi:hypothetical protein